MGVPVSAFTRLFGRTFDAALRVTATTARIPGMKRATEGLLGGVGALWARLRVPTPPGPTDDVRALAEAWQEAMPSKRSVPITSVDATTAHAEIHVTCPLRGSGDVAACHRLMAYDRAFAARSGARFVVLQSQAQPGVTVCKVALRRMELDASDLVDVGAPTASKP